MPKQKLIVCNPGIFFEDRAPAVYPWILNKLSPDLGTKAYELQAKYETIKADGPGLLPEMAELFKGIKNINGVCRQYCWEHGRREAYEVFQKCKYPYILVTSLPLEICSEFLDILHAGESIAAVSSNVIERGGASPKKLFLVDRESRKNMALVFIDDMIRSAFLTSYKNVIVIGKSLTDVPLGKAVQEKGGRFVAFRSSDGDPMVMGTYIYGGTLERLFSCEGLI
jgi:hypothetical protein